MTITIGAWLSRNPGRSDAAGAVYLRPDQAWGLDIWAQRPEDALVKRSLDVHAAYYAMLHQMLTSIAAEHGHHLPCLDGEIHTEQDLGGTVASLQPMDFEQCIHDSLISSSPR